MSANPPDLPPRAPMETISLRRLAKAMRSAVESELPEDEPNEVRAWVYRTCAKTALSLLPRRAALAAERGPLDALALNWRKLAVAMREEADRIRRTINHVTGAEERCYVRAELLDNCAKELLDAHAAERLSVIEECAKVCDKLDSDANERLHDSHEHEYAYAIAAARIRALGGETK